MIKLMENIKLIFRDNLKKFVKTSFFDADDVLISVIKPSRMIYYR